MAMSPVLSVSLCELTQTLYMLSRAIRQECVKSLTAKGPCRKHTSVALTASKPFIKMEAFSALREDATEKRVITNPMPGNGNMAFSVSLSYPSSQISTVTKACWAQRLSTETLRRDFKEVKDYVHQYRDTEIQARYQKVLQKGAFLPSQCCSCHLNAKASTPAKPLWLFKKLKKHGTEGKWDACWQRLEQKSRWRYDRRSEPAGQAAVSKFPSDVSTSWDTFKHL